MAQKVSVSLVDDTDGSEADETVQFGIDGARYEIDVNSRHAQDLRAALAGYVGKARKVSGAALRARARKAAVNGDSNKRIREWAAEHGHKVNERGRVPADINAKYEAATGE